jgi:hypothetical protein
MAKTQYLDKQRMEFDATKRENIRLNQELVNCKAREQNQKQKLMTFNG